MPLLHIAANYAINLIETVRRNKMDYNADWYPACTLDPDWQDRGNHNDNTEERIYDHITDTFQSSANDVFSIVLDYADQEAIAQTLKAMVIAYDNSLNAGRKVDREQSAQDFIVFAKSFANVCISAIEKEAEQNA
jgi:hypothetical protein